MSVLQGDKKVCAIYCRCAQKNDIAIEQQRQRLVAYARDMGYTAQALYIDNGYSAHNTERPGLDKLNADIAAGRVGVVLWCLLKTTAVFGGMPQGA